ncbi:hypothetical protein [Isoptericola sp. AK164]|uniref:hypothetical protein n=1 Tax=Isoptericola sp. AK164 TaxID=3024246 RepID=UPI00241824D5|nr:hypothetical protein [Isoptericola sp. AK164]
MSLELVKTDRFIDRSKFAVYDFPSLDSFLSAEKISTGIQCINDGGLPIDMHYTSASSRTLVVVFHGAAAENVRLPWLIGQGVTKDIGVSRLFISDPSLYLTPEVKLSWFAGNHAQPDLQHKLVQIVSRVAQAAGADYLVFLGGSGGGFAALKLSHAFPGSLAVPMNPQTLLERHHPTTLGKYAQHCWNGAAFVDLPRNIVTSLPALYAQGTPNTVAYLQNDDDEFHIRNHLNPFIDSLPPDAMVGLLRRPWGERHQPPPRDLVRHLMRRAAEVEGDWQLMLDTEGFITVAEYNGAYPRPGVGHLTDEVMLPGR